MQQRGGRPDSQGAPASRRVVLVASGGVMLAIAAAVGWKGGGHGSAVPAGAPARPGRPVPGAHGSRAGKTVRVTSAEASPRPSAHPETEPARAPAGGSGAGGTAAAEPVYYLDDGPLTIALTIDDGPSPVYTPQVLRILDKYKITASFSMVGENVSYYPGLAREVADAGHVIINHTWDHSNLAELSATAARTEIARAGDAIHAAVGARPEIFRAPYGAWSRTTLEYCASERLMPLDWSVDPRDWARPGVAAIVTNIMRNTRTGSIILEHDGGGDRSQTVAALKVVIPRLLDQGYRFRSV